MKYTYFAFLLALALLFSGGCEDSKNVNPDPTENLFDLGSQSDNGLTVDLFSDAELGVGLNTLYFRLTDADGNTITKATITQKPVMNMEDMKHSCPTTNPSGTANEDGLFTGEVVFIMASGMMGSWDDSLTIHDENTNIGYQVVFSDLSVRETGMKKDLVFYNPDSSQSLYIITLNGLEAPQAGANPITVTVHQKQSMMAFPAVSGLTVAMNPQMPDMGHGSTGNVDPVYTRNGKYEGSVVFSMTGYWTIDFTFVDNGDTLGVVQYEINF